MAVHKMMLQQFPAMAARQQQMQQQMAQRLQLLRAGRTHTEDNGEIFDIPVAFHIVAKNKAVLKEFNRAKIMEIIAMLNNAFNANDPQFWTHTPSTFISWQADLDMNFCLGKYFDANKRLREAITYTQASVSSYNPVNPAQPHKNSKSATGGHSPLNPQKFLNIWITPLEGVNGYSTFPGALEAWQGITVDPSIFRFQSSNNQVRGMGKTLIHEIGHYFFLRHTWGDVDCGNDFIPDTPPAKDGHGFGIAPANIETPYRKNVCSTDPRGEMFCNYMTYMDDVNRTMFTLDQREVMRSMLLKGGPREALLYSDACSKPPTLAKNCCPKIDAVNARLVADNAVRLIWAPKRAATNGYFVRYRPVWNKTWSPPIPVKKNGHVQQHLKLETSYVFQVAARCGAKSTGPWAFVGATTAGKCPQAPPQLTTTTTAGTITVSWASFNKNDFKEAVIQEAPGQQTNPTTPFFDGVRTNANQVVFNNLKPGTRYRIQVLWQCLAGKFLGRGSTLGRQVYITTGGCTAIATPFTSNITTSSVILFPAVANAGHTRLEGNFRIVGSSQWSNTKSSSSGTLITFSGLQPQTNYQFRVRAKCADGSYTAYKSVNLLTLAPAGNALPVDEPAQFSMYPNPARAGQVITLEQTAGQQQQAYGQLRVINSRGEAIRQQPIANAGNVQFALRNLPPGIYLVVLQKGTLTTTKRLMITQ